MDLTLHAAQVSIGKREQMILSSPEKTRSSKIRGTGCQKTDSDPKDNQGRLHNFARSTVHEIETSRFSLQKTAYAHTPCRNA